MISTINPLDIQVYKKIRRNINGECTKQRIDDALSSFIKFLEIERKILPGSHKEFLKHRYQRKNPVRKRFVTEEQLRIAIKKELE